MKDSTFSSMEEQTPSSVFANTEFCEPFSESPVTGAELERDRCLRELNVDSLANIAASTSVVATDSNNMQGSLTETEGNVYRGSLAQESENGSLMHRAIAADAQQDASRGNWGSNQERGDGQGNRTADASSVDSVDSKTDFCFPDLGNEVKPMVDTALERIVLALLRGECKTSKALFERVLGFESVPYEESMYASSGAALDPAELLYAYLHNLYMFFVRARHPKTMQVKQLAEYLLQHYQALVEAEKCSNISEQQTEVAECLDSRN